MRFVIGLFLTYLYYFIMQIIKNIYCVQVDIFAKNLNLYLRKTKPDYFYYCVESTQ